MHHNTPHTQLRNQLVEAMKRYVTDETILEAFRIIARHKFVDAFLTRSAENARRWHQISPADPGWLEEIYKDRPLTTSLDQNGDPNVSSSQPHLMARMMQSVKIQRGQRVLEIGTGTGYNAALLASLVGAENVVSVDINTALLAVARERIESSIDPGVTLLHADGRQLPEIGQFDAIIVTAAHVRLEPSWIRALALGGRIVLNLQLGRLSSVMIEAEKVSHGLIGHVAPYSGDFMLMHDGNCPASTHIPFPHLGLVTCEEFRPHLEAKDFLFFLHIHLHILISRYRNRSGERSYAIKDVKEDRTVLFAPCAIRGDASLWQEIRALSEQFEALDKPECAAFTFTTDVEGCMTFRIAGR